MKIQQSIAHGHHLIKALRVIILDKLTSTKIYSILILKAQNKPSINIYFKKLFNGSDNDGQQFMCYCI